jgi:hypothetical protein
LVLEQGGDTMSAPVRETAFAAVREMLDSSEAPVAEEAAAAAGALARHSDARGVAALLDLLTAPSSEWVPPGRSRLVLLSC